MWRFPCRRSEWLLRRLDIVGNPYVGVLCRASDALAVLAPEAPKRLLDVFGEALGVPVVSSTMGGANVVGSLLTLNAHGAVVTGFATEKERAALGDLNVLVLPHRLNAAGNNVLCNDRGAVVHPGYDERTIRLIADALAVEVARGTLAGMRTVGSAGVATNRGVLAHPHATAKELEVLQDVLKVPATITTANYGTAQVGACLVANSRGAVVGNRTTPIEMGRIEEGLVYF